MQATEEKHRAMILDINDSLNKSSDRLNKTVTEELKSTRKSLNDLQLSQQVALSKIREEITEKIHKTLSEQGKAQQETLQNSLKNTALQLIAVFNYSKLQNVTAFTAVTL